MTQQTKYENIIAHNRLNSMTDDEALSYIKNVLSNNQSFTVLHDGDLQHTYNADGDHGDLDAGAKMARIAQRVKSKLKLHQLQRKYAQQQYLIKRKII